MFSLLKPILPLLPEDMSRKRSQLGEEILFLQRKLQMHVNFSKTRVSFHKEDGYVMPDYFAHIQFGQTVLGVLPASLQSTIRAELEAFQIGCLGPDILFFYHPLIHTPPSAEGHTLHKLSALPVFQRLLDSVRQDLPMSRGYSAGFLCHLAADSAAHSYIDVKVTEGKITHLAIESELDRYLICQAGLPVRKHTYLPPQAEKAVYEAAAAAFSKADAKQCEKGFQSMRRITKLLSRCYGTKVGAGANWGCEHFKRLHLESMVGAIVRSEPAQASIETTQALIKILEQSVPVAKEQIELFFASAKDLLPLSPWLNQNFHGVFFGAEPSADSCGNGSA